MKNVTHIAVGFWQKGNSFNGQGISVYLGDCFYNMGNR